MIIKMLLKKVNGVYFDISPRFNSDGEIYDSCVTLTEPEITLGDMNYPAKSIRLFCKINDLKEIRDLFNEVIKHYEDQKLLTTMKGN